MCACCVRWTRYDLFIFISLGVGRDKALQIRRYKGSDKHEKHKIQKERSGALKSEEDFEGIEGDYR